VELEKNRLGYPLVHLILSSFVQTDLMDLVYCVEILE
jgi:hypothetical protein